ncbi:NAD(P)-binding protein [Artomyces pyxidatus]|uniref:NAD(P)-binding protein n=1 Tax=Artomyces pyxidatus TaxID=48021 RepID=A0ACB8SQK1_9AGAM|nr:NAD(P)-binding protein [Artomyces pyxidatus]
MSFWLHSSPIQPWLFSTRRLSRRRVSRPAPRVLTLSMHSSFATCSTRQTALIIGATGQVGQHLLRELLASSHFTRVTEAGRRVTPANKLPSAATSKLEQVVIDFENTEGLKQILSKEKQDVVFITLGTKAKLAGSPANFEKIDREYVVNAAKAARSTDPEHRQRIVYCSSGMSNPSSSALYIRSKGLTEKALADLGYSDCIIFNPGMLQNLHRDYSHTLETILSRIASFLSYFTWRLGIDVDALAKSMRIAGEFGTGALPFVAEASEKSWGGATFTTVGNRGAVRLSREPL